MVNHMNQKKNMQLDLEFSMTTLNSSKLIMKENLRLMI
jgi:hypothetical protein